MQFLFEELFGNLYRVSKGKTNSIFLVFLVRALIYLIIAFAIALVIYSVTFRRYLFLSIFIGIVVIGEIAHYLRKSMEKRNLARVPKNKKLLEIN